jgi:hypothetical protein
LAINALNASLLLTSVSNSRANSSVVQSCRHAFFRNVSNAARQSASRCRFSPDGRQLPDRAPARGVSGIPRCDRARGYVVSDGTNWRVVVLPIFTDEDSKRRWARETPRGVLKTLSIGIGGTWGALHGSPHPSGSLSPALAGLFFLRQERPERPADCLDGPQALERDKPPGLGAAGPRPCGDAGRGSRWASRLR